jgi:YD repeat-containing protein
MTSRYGWLSSLALALLIFSFDAAAQTATTNPEEEYKKLVKVNTEIQPLGENPFGEQVNVFDGSLSFHVVDISVPGTGPTIEIGRTFHADGDAAVRWSDSEFGDWDLYYPRLTTLTSAQDTIIAGPNQIGWLVNSVDRTDRCTNFREPPDQRVGRPGSDPLSSDAWWNQGYTLQIPGVADQDMLNRVATSPAAPTVDGYNYVAVSKGRWHLGCPGPTANGADGETFGGEAFQAVGPNGQKYLLNELLYRPARSFGIIRNLGVMAATRMDDRFGNYVLYNWTNRRLTSIVASDGRTVTIEYGSDGKHIAKINVVTPGDGTRSWTYGYTAVSGGQVLSSVTLPDGSSWTYDLSQLTYDVKSSAPPGHCNDVAEPLDSAQVGTITGPSGIQGRFEAHPTRHARSDVPEACSANTPSGQGSERRPRYTNNLALTSKTFSGAGITTQTWSYSYPLAVASWRANCGADCVRTSVSLLVDPSGNTTRYSFFNSADANEGKPVATEYFSGDTSGTLLRSESFSYADAGQGPWPTTYGGGFNVMANLDRQEREAPQAQRVITQDGDSFTRQALQFDGYARPSLTRRFSSLSEDFTVDEGHSYLDNTDRSIIGLPLQETSQSKGQASSEVVSQNSYDANLVLLSRDRFGQRAMTYGFNDQGQLASFTDPLGHQTTLSNYVLGIPTSITFPDASPGHPGGTVESLTVDGFGEIRSITDQAGATTSYSYDALGRVAQITYPADSTVAWAPRQFTYAFSPDARGMGGNHWVRTVVQGNYSEQTDFDAMLRPVMFGKSELGTGALYVSTRTEYDWKGRKVFESYPVDGAQSRGDISQGVTTVYDALGREISRTQTAEIAGVSTTTAYLQGGVRQVTDPNGNIVTSANQAFDEPSYDKPVLVSTNDGQTAIAQSITRNVFGEPTVISQGGVDRKLYYDPQHRLCRTFDPETMSEMTMYDAAGNAIGSASGQNFDGDGCGYEQVAQDSMVTRSYDGMNRLTSVTYPHGTPSLAFTYDPLGNPATAISTASTTVPGSTGTASWAFGRNSRGMLTTEMLSVGDLTWIIGYDYDANSNLAATHYPDGKVVTYTANGLGQPTAAGVYATGATYTPDGQLKTFNFGNGTPYSAHLNSRNLLGDFAYGVTDAYALTEAVQYDKNANITSVQGILGANQRMQAFAYDGLNRLTEATGVWGSENYGYDTANNIHTVTNSNGTSVFNYDIANRLQSISGPSPHSFEYDEQGNVTQRDGQAIVFDLANRLLSVNGSGDYLYDASGRRVRAATPSGTTYYAYNSEGQLLWQFDPANNIGTDFIYLGKKLVASTNNVVMPNAAPTLTVPASVNEGTGYTVFWTVVTSATSYELQQQPDGGAWTTIATGTSTSLALTQSSAETLHYQVRACNAGGCGPWSTQATTVVTAPPLAPISPSSIVGSLDSGQQSITVSWSASNGATYYNLQAMTGGAWSDAYSGSALSSSVPASADGTYTFQVRACNAVGCSAWLQSTSVVVQHTPGAPASLSVPPSGTGSLAISWPSSTYATSYVLQQSTDNVNYADVWSGPGTSTTYSTGASGVYYFRVRACNGVQCSGYGPVGVSTVTIAPSQPPGISVAATSSNGCFTVNWGGVPGAASYVMQEQVNGSEFATIANDGSGVLNMCGKGNGTYGYRVQACNAGGCGPFSGTASVVVSLVPPIPSVHMTDTVVGKSERYTLIWDPSPGATRYEIYAVQLDKIVFTSTGTSQQVEAGISPYELKYTWRIRACNDQGCSAWSGDIAG